MRFANLTFCLCRWSVADNAQWFHTIPPMGEYPGGNVCHNGEPVKDAVIVIDRAAYDSLLANFYSDQARISWPGLLVDREHFSLDSDKPSDAMAWAKNIREDEDGLWTQWEFTPPGRDAWDNKVLISRSPVMILERIEGNRFRPVRLDSIAMTNTPHFDLSTIAAARAAGDQTKQGDPNMKKLLALLGLPETATEDEACAKVQGLMDSASTATAAKQTAEDAAKAAQAACRKAQCAAFIAEHKDKITDVAKFRDAYEKNPEATEAAFGLFKADAAAAPTRISARDAATPGDGTPVTLAAYRAMPAGKDKDAFLSKNKDTLLRLEREEKK